MLFPASRCGKRLENDGTSGGELIHRESPAFESQWIHSTRHLRPDFTAVTRRRNRNRRRLENLNCFLQGLDNVDVVIVNGADALEASVAVTVFRCDVDRGVTIAVDSVHGVTARIEREVTNESARVYVVDPRQPRHLFSRQIPRFAIPGLFEESARQMAVELRHTNFERNVRISVPTAMVILIGSCEDMPRIRRVLRRHNGGFSVNKIVREILLDVNHFFFEISMRKRL